MLKIAVRNLTRKSMRTWLTIVSISIGIASVVVIGAIGDAGKAAVTSELDNMGITGLSVSTAAYGTSTSVHLQMDELNAIRELPSVENAMPLIMYYTDSTLKGEKSDSLVWGIDSGAKQIISLELLHGRLINKNDVEDTAKVCLVDQNYALSTYGRENIVGKTMQILMNGNEETYEIVGIVSAGSSIMQNVIGNYVPSIVYVPYTSLQEYAVINKFDQIAVKVNPGSNVEDAQSSIISALDQVSGTTGAFHAENLAKQRDQLMSMLDIITLVLSLIGGISLIVAGLGIMTIMLVSVTERTREIGIKKAIGAKNHKIMVEFLLEAVFITAIGSLLGALVGLGISMLGLMAVGMSAAIQWPTILNAIGVSMLIGVFFGVYPAYKASKLRPVEALRIE
ncbi:ABC transporter permease [Solibaculum intestinale]|uniref:ABC transporter permease n=1 Tax=Solibaculum intestinale TaxID=3133165 RepID=A0ABV1DWM4_9FIRM